VVLKEVVVIAAVALRATIFTAKPRMGSSAQLFEIWVAFITTHWWSGSGFKKKELTELRLELKTPSVVNVLEK
jgi:hypothetical protein